MIPFEDQLTHFGKLGKAEEEYTSKVKQSILLSKKARNLGIDPMDYIESKIVLTNYERISEIVGLKGLHERLRELGRKIKNPYILAYQIAEDIVLGKFAFLNDETALLMATRTAIAILTKGMKHHYITSITKVEIRKNGDATPYPAIILSENTKLPIRLILFLMVLVDRLRKPLGLDRWKIETFSERTLSILLKDFYMHISKKRLPLYEVLNLLRNIPIEIDEEGINNRPHISRFISKLLTTLPNYYPFLKKLRRWLNLEGWNWIEQLTYSAKPEVLNTILVSSGSIGSFRLKPVPNFPKNLVGIHPAIYTLFDGKITYGTRVYIGKKGPFGVAFLRNLEAPVVKLKDGSVKLYTGDINIKEKIEKVLFLGDLALASRETNIYTEDNWFQDINKVIKNEEIAKINIQEEVSFNVIKEFSEKYGIPLHPRYVFFLQLLSVSEILKLRSLVKSFLIEETPRLIFNEDAKSLLEKALVPFSVVKGEVYVQEDNALALYYLIRPEKELRELPAPISTLELLSLLSGVKIKNKLSLFLPLSFKIRFEKGRTEKFENPHVIFPLGDYYHVSNDILDHEVVYVEIANLYCEKCSIFVPTKKCPKCGTSTKLMYFCEQCRRLTAQKVCEVCGSKTKPNYLRGINLNEFLKQQSMIINLKPLKPLIGVENLHSSIKIPEPISKGIIRQYHALTVSSDATIKLSTYLCCADVIEVGQTGTSLEEMIHLGYKSDVFGCELTSEKQMIRLKPFDIIIPKEVAKLFLKVSRYLDELLTRLYHVGAYYKAEAPKDLLGHLVVIVPKGSNTGIILRISGFTNDDVAYIHPSISQAFDIKCGLHKGSLMLLMDVLLNFSKYYINEKETSGSPYFLQPIFMKIKNKNSTIFSTYTNLKKSPADKNNFKDAYEALQFQIRLIKSIKALSDKESLHYIMNNVIIRNLFRFAEEATTSKFICVGCGRTFRRIPLSKRCPSCKKEVKSFLSPMTFTKSLHILRNLVDWIDDPAIKEKFLLALENIDMLTKVKKQTSIADFF